MSEIKLHRSIIRGTGSYLPEKLLANVDLEKLVETNDEWIRERTGIFQRHIASEEQQTSDLATIASQRALKAASLDAKDIDMILFATVSPDKIMPNAACVLQKKLGCGPIMSVDLSAACTGFVYALSVANKFIQTGSCKNILVVGAEVLHRYVNYTDRETCILFGDGAGAAILSRADDSEDSEIISEKLMADGSIHDLFELPTGAAENPFSGEVKKGDFQFMRMKGREVFRHAVRTMTLCCEKVLEETGLTQTDIDWLVPHQANARILGSVAKHFHFPAEKVVINLDRTGNTSAATIPVALDEAIRDGRVQRGQRVLLTAFGAGITSGSLLLRY